MTLDHLPVNFIFIIESWRLKGQNLKCRGFYSIWQTNGEMHSFKGSWTILIQSKKKLVILEHWRLYKQNEGASKIIFKLYTWHGYFWYQCWNWRLPFDFYWWSFAISQYGSNSNLVIKLRLNLLWKDTAN